MNFKIPKFIKVGGYVYKVLYPYSFKERADILGQCDNDLFEIRIKDIEPGGSKLPKEQIFTTFLHELLHAINFVYGDNKIEEKTITEFSHGIFQIFNEYKEEIKENTKIDEYLKLDYPITITKQDSGEYLAEILSLPGCLTVGDTIEEVLKNIENAKRDWIKACLHIGRKVPAPMISKKNSKEVNSQPPLPKGRGL